MTWIDQKKSCDMVPYTQIAECSGMQGVADNIKTLPVNHYGKLESDTVLTEFRIR